MAAMLRALVFATLFSVIASPGGGAGQPVSVLHIKVVLVDAERKITPVPRHALLISDNPATAAPRLIVTGPDGTANVNLRPGNYTVESDRPVAFLGKAYQWTQNVDVAAGRDAVLELTADNADGEPATAATTSAATPLAADPSVLLMQWQTSVVTLWTQTTQASGFVIDTNGLVATSQRVIGAATQVEVQLTPAIKVTGSVLVTDPVRDVAIIQVDPQALTSVRPVPLECAAPSKSPLVEGQDIFTVGASLHEPNSVTSGIVRRVEARAIVSDFILERGTAGGPVFTADGSVVGLTSVLDENDQSRRRGSRVIAITEACEAVASGDKKAKGAAPPGGMHLPVEPERPYPVDALKEAAQRRAGSLSPYQMPASDFDVAFITPVLAYGAQNRDDAASGRERSQSTSKTDPNQTAAHPLTDFRNWSEYVGDFPPVLMVRVTPKLVEGFWTTVARGAVRTQGVSLPPIKHVKSGFARLRAWCGAAEVTPVHPFKLEQRVSESEVIYEGLYVFDPDALGPQCGTVKLVLYSDKERDKGDTRVLDPKVVQQIWDDFTPYRALK